VLVRLRRMISTPTDVVTRKKLAQRVGLSASTIREIETGGFKLTPAVAQRIMLETGASTQSLLTGEDPLKDYSGKILTPSSAVGGMLELYYQHEMNIFAMLEAALKAAKEKHRGRIFYELFKEWLPQAVAAIGATLTMKAVLNRNLGAFDPYHVFEEFQPKDAKTKARWDAAWTRLVTSVAEKAGGLESDEYAKAYQEILNSGRLRETVPEAAKPVSGKRSRSAGRPAA
jgi:transcriptional regulator with XRE-family HTH domain